MGCVRAPLQNIVKHVTRLEVSRTVRTLICDTNPNSKDTDKAVKGTSTTPTTPHMLFQSRWHNYVDANRVSHSCTRCITKSAISHLSVYSCNSPHLSKRSIERQLRLGVTLDCLNVVYAFLSRVKSNNTKLYSYNCAVGTAATRVIP